MKHLSGWRSGLVTLAFVAFAGAVLAADFGRVTKILHPTVQTFDANGRSVGTLNASDVRLPTTIVQRGTSGELGIRVNGKTIYLRSLDVATAGGPSGGHPGPRGPNHGPTPNMPDCSATPPNPKCPAQ
ncbi:MAG TPA: hypothetical protein VGL66_17720 [Caulobacteraceae bacterium]|jgi:hypothetical protein